MLRPKIKFRNERIYLIHVALRFNYLGKYFVRRGSKLPKF